MKNDSYHEQVSAMIGILIKQPMSRTELQMFTGLCQITVDKWIKAMRARKLIYIADYDLDVMGRLRIHKYLFDPGKSDIPVKVAKQRLKERNNK